MTGGEDGVGRRPDVIVNVGEYPAPEALIKAGVQAAVAAAKQQSQVAPSEISVTLLDDGRMTELNARYLGHDRSTDVISFALGEGDGAMGDIYLGAERARAQAAELGISEEEELLRLAVHGTLHLLGFDHQAPDEAHTMERLECRILSRLGYADPYTATPSP